VEDHTVFEAEGMGLTLVAELVRVEGYMESAEIGADSQVVLQVMKNEGCIRSISPGQVPGSDLSGTEQAWRIHGQAMVDPGA